MSIETARGKIYAHRFHEQVILILAFFGAAMFAGLIFILQSPQFADRVGNSTAVAQFTGPYPAQSYTAGLETTLGALSVVSAVVCIASSRAISYEMKNARGERALFEFVDILVLIVFIGFGISIFFLLLPFTMVGADIVAVVLLFLFIVFGWLFAWARRGSFLSFWTGR